MELLYSITNGLLTLGTVSLDDFFLGHFRKRILDPCLLKNTSVEGVAIRDENERTRIGEILSLESNQQWHACFQNLRCAPCLSKLEFHLVSMYSIVLRKAEMEAYVAVDELVKDLRSMLRELSDRDTRFVVADQPDLQLEDFW